MDKLNFKYEKNIEFGKRARSLIPAGAHTYSKADDQFSYNAPRIIERGQGCYLWDVDGNRFQDMGMSLGACMLGHAYEPILDAVRAELSNGVNFLRPAKIEGDLAEIVCDLIPSADMVKFGKNGSDVTTAAVKLARAFTGRKYIARCAEHPFFSLDDWFIGSTVVTRGVPEEISNLTLQFKYNDIEGLENLFQQYPNQIAGVILEPVSQTEPKENYLKDLKAICEKNGAVLIFDEIVCGFRFQLGGVQKMYGVTPHLSTFGKAVGNGFSCSFLVGRKDIMNLGGIDEGERVFLLSTTHGAETHCLAAAKAVIAEFKKNDIVGHFWKTGKMLQDGVNKIAEQLGATKYVKTFGYPVKPGFSFLDENGEASMTARTLFLEETTARGLLMPYVAPCYAHKEEHINFAVDVIGDALKSMKHFAENGGMIKGVQGELVKPVFRKFN